MSLTTTNNMNAVHIFKSEADNQHYFHVLARNGKIIAQSEGYKTKAGATKGIKALKKALPDEPKAKPTVEERASLLYSVYCEAVGGVAFNGDALPWWEDFAADPGKQLQADAWRSVAKQSLGID